MFKVAFASKGMSRVDEHFGTARSFVIFEVAEDGSARRLEVLQFASEEKDGNEDKLIQKLQLLEGCAAIYCLAVGPSAVRQLLARNVQPIRVDEEAEISRLLERLRDEVVAGKTPWINRYLKSRTDAAARIEQLADEDWEE